MTKIFIAKEVNLRDTNINTLPSFLISLQPSVYAPKFILAIVVFIGLMIKTAEKHFNAIELIFKLIPYLYKCSQIESLCSYFYI